MFIRFLLCIFLVSSLSGCVKNKIFRGYTFDQEKIDRIEIGKSRKASVKNILGSPSAEATYGGDVWYYIASTFEQKAFFEPVLVDQKVLVIRFDTKQNVTAVETLNTNDAKQIAYIKDKTNAEGHDLTIVEQLLGNVGRFSSAPGAGK